MTFYATGRAQIYSGEKRVEKLRQFRANHLDARAVNGHCNHQTPKADHVQFALTLIQGKWKIGILSRLHQGPARLSELRKALPEASKKMLVQHLREMEKDGLILRIDMSGKLKHVEYSLTKPFGLATVRLLSALAEWATDYPPTESEQDEAPSLFDA